MRCYYQSISIDCEIRGDRDRNAIADANQPLAPAMNQTAETDRFLDNLERFAQSRLQVARDLEQIAQTLEQSETESERQSGKLGFNREIEDLTQASQNLKHGVFRLLVLGDMKRGKSTFLNALIGEKLLPSDVNPCTALLTVLRYGDEKKVTLYYNDDTPPETIDFKTFKRNYTIDPAEAKQLEKEKKQAFPNIDYAVVEYPLPLLEKGVEIVDSPGLNDTEARNDLSLGYVNNCHAILFVLRATQPCTLAERRYLENYIKDRGLTVFFLINAWDQIRDSLIDPDDEEEVEEAEDKLHRVFHANLEDYTRIDDRDAYDDRVFAVSSIDALRRRVKNKSASLEGTGFPPFIDALDNFLTRERGVAKLRQVRTLAQQANKHVGESVERRIPLIEENVNDLKQRIASVEPEFQKLKDIRDRFQAKIHTVRDRKATTIADSFRSYVLKLGDTFETDFVRYQPDLRFIEFLVPGKKEEFERGLQQAFEQYVTDKLAEWTRAAEREMEAAFVELSNSAAEYGASYTKVTDRITEKLTGRAIEPGGSVYGDDGSPGWAKWAMGLVSLASGNLAGVALAGAGFDWKNILLNTIAVVGVGGLIASVSGIVLGPIGIGLLGLGIGALQADKARQQLLKAAQKELVKYLPQVANERWQQIHDAIEDCFDAYEQEVSDRINDDIQSRQAELDNLIQQKESREIDREQELNRLHQLQQQVSDRLDRIEAEYQQLLAAL